jgi:hemerythrin-like domain-containing protein
MMNSPYLSRRALFAHFGQITAAMSVAGMSGHARAQTSQPEPKPGGEEGGKEEVSVAEDLMREHGVLRRILLIYDDAQARLNTGVEYPIETLKDATGIIRRFIEEYHEKLEEEYVFPLFEKAGPHADLAKTLRRQHEVGRKTTQFILDNANAETVKDETARNALAQHLAMFTRLYRPHAAREDTVLFPAVRQAMTPAEYEMMGETFEDREHQLFGESGFGEIVAQVAELEKRLGLYDLNQFDARV